MRSRRLSLLGIGLGLLFMAAVANASVPLGSDRIRLSGFATLGAVRGGDETLGFRRDLVQDGVFDEDWALNIESLLGLQLDADFSDALSATVQMVYEDRTDAELKDYLEWAYLRYRFGPSWTLRAGRLGIDVFMLSEYRKLGFSYLWARPPVEFYSPVVFNHFEGADLAYNAPLGVGTFTAKLFAGQTDNEFHVFGQNLELDLRPLGGTFGWETEDWQTRLSVVSVSVDAGQDYLAGTEMLIGGLQAVAPLWPDAANYTNAFSLQDKTFYYYALGAAYDNQSWVVQSEINYVDTGTLVFRSFAGGYLSLGYRVADDTTVYGVLSKVKNTQARVDVSDPPPVPGYEAQLLMLQQTLQTFFSGSSFNQQTASLGVRWDLRYNLALKLQWDHTAVDAYGSGLWDQREILDHDETFDTFSINLNGVF